MLSVYELPSVKRFISKITDRLRTLHSCLVLLPETISVDLLSQEIKDRLSKEGLWYETLGEYNNHENSRLPLTKILNAIGVKWQDQTVPRTIKEASDNLLIPDHMPDVLFVDSFHSDSRNLGWKGMHFLPEWAKLVKNMKDRGKRLPSICQIISANHSTIAPDEVLFFKVFYWWGFPSVLELQLLFDEIGGGGEATSVHEIWKKMIIPWLCASDLPLLNQLYEQNFELAITEQLLDNIAMSRGWDLDALYDLEIKNIFCNNIINIENSMTRPLSAVMPAWAKGIVGYCPEYGIAISPVALKAMGMKQEIRHRYWRAQCAFLLPLLDRCRLEMCQYLNQKHGDQWPLAYVQPIDQNETQSLKDSPFNCQYGHMETVLGSCLKTFKNDIRFKKYIYKFRQTRNMLAHNQPISYAKFNSIIKDIINFQNVFHSIESN